MKRVAVGAFVVLGCLGIFLALQSEHVRHGRPRDVTTRVLPGQTEYGKGNYTEAEKQTEKAITPKPKNNSLL